MLKNQNKTGYDNWYAKWNNDFQDGSDTNLAKLFIANYGKEFIFFDKKLYYYNGVFWEYNESKNILRKMITDGLVKIYTKKIKDTYTMLHHTDDNKNLKGLINTYTEIQKCLSGLSKINNILACVLIFIEKYVELDKNPYYFAFNNCIFDLRTGKKLNLNHLYLLA